MGLENVGGIFLVLLVGLCLSCLIACCEFTWNKQKNRNKQVSKRSRKEKLFFFSGQSTNALAPPPLGLVVKRTATIFF